MKAERSIIRGHATFCDDIRQEIGGKVSLIGVYNAALILQGASFPVTLAKLCVVATIRLYRDEPLPSKLVVKVFLPGNETPAIDSDLTLPAQMAAPPPIPAAADSENVDSFWSVGLNVMLSPIELKEAGYIRVRAYADDIEWKIGALQVSEDAPPSN